MLQTGESVASLFAYDIYPGADPGFFSGGGALVSCSTSTPVNHIVFWGQNTSCIRKPQVISGRGGANPLHPPPRSAPDSFHYHSKKTSCGLTKQNFLGIISSISLIYASMEIICVDGLNRQTQIQTYVQIKKRKTNRGTILN